MISALLDHLWQSTAFACVAGLLTLTLRSNAASIRYWLWFAASAKFLIPFSLLSAAASHLIPADTQSFVAPLTLDRMPLTFDQMQQVVAPFSAPSVAITAPGVHMPSLSAILLAVWGAGSVVLLLYWLTRWLRLRTALRAAVPFPMALPVPVKTSASVLEPGLIGIWRPVLLIPEGIAERLSPREMDAIIAHELCHLHRRDNLTAALHMLVEAAFWFHPLIWWLGAKLIAERERACDESVLTSSGDPQVYAESILKVCRFYVQSPLACAAGVSGADLRKRVEEIMRNRASIRMNAAKKILLASAASIALAVPLVAGCVASPKPAVQQQKVATPLVAGKWAAEDILPNGTATKFVLDLTVDGEKLSGAFTVIDGPPVQFHDGTVSGVKVSFLATRQTGQYGEVTTKNSGEVKGDELLLTREIVGTVIGGNTRQPSSMLFKRIPPGTAPKFSTPSAAELIAQRRIEQAQPRTAVPFDPPQFDKFAGYYKLGVEAFFTVTRKDDHFYTRLTGQNDVEEFPESPTKFFAKVVPAQISFITDAQGNATELVLHQNGLEQHAFRVDKSVVDAVEEPIRKHIADGKPDPERGALLRRVLAAGGGPDPEVMAPGLLAAATQQQPQNQQMFEKMGKFLSMAFLHVDQRGWDTYEVTYEHGHMTWAVGPLSPDHKLQGAFGR